MDDRQSPVLIRGLKFFQQWVQAVKPIEGNGLLLTDGDAGAGIVITIVLEGRNQVQAIGAAAQENDHQRSALISIAGNEGLNFGHINTFEKPGRRASKPAPRQTRGKLE